MARAAQRFEVRPVVGSWLGGVASVAVVDIRGRRDAAGVLACWMLADVCVADALPAVAVAWGAGAGASAPVLGAAAGSIFDDGVAAGLGAEMRGDATHVPPHSVADYCLSRNGGASSATVR